MEIVISTTSIGNDAVQTANARDIHKELGVKKDFSDWVKVQINRADLVENADYVTVPLKGVGGKFDSVEYHMTIESGKHIAMMSATAKGKEVRNYFIECEKKVKQGAAAAMTPGQLMLMYAQQNLAIEQEQMRQSMELKRIADSVAQMEARTQPDNKHYTVMGFCNLIGKSIDYESAKAIGKKCAKLSRMEGVVVGKVGDPRFGAVGTYHEYILKKAMGLQP